MTPSLNTSHREEEALGKAYDSRLMKRLLAYLKPYRLKVIGAILILMASSGLQIVGPWLTQVALDRAIPDGDVGLLTLLAAAFIGATVFIFFLEYAQRIITTWLGQRVMYDLRGEVFRKLQRMDLSYYDRNPVGRMMTRITNDVETLNQLFSSGVVAVFGDVFTLLFIVVAMLSMDWQLALVAFSVLPLVALAAFFFRAKVRDAYRDIRVRLARINAFLQERITGIQVVQLFNREAADLQRHEELNQDYLEAHLRSITYYALFFPVIELFTAIAVALILWYGGSSILAGTATVGVIAAFLQYARRFFRPIQDLSEKYNLLQAAMASSERIFRLLDREPRIVDPEPVSAGTGDERPDPVSAEVARADSRPVSAEIGKGDARGSIEFRDVCFAYGDDEDGRPDWVLHDVSFRVSPGEKVAIVGHTGAGKTTLINLLMRFYDPQKGAVLLDGVPVNHIPLRTLRRRIGLVLQDVFLFSKDIRFNLNLGDESIPEERLAAAARRVGADRIIERLPEGLDQPLGERGASLSVGERQLISFARALAFDPEILVLDEATSSVDSEIEARIEEATEKLLAGRTSLVIAHRLSTIQGADRILVFHHGRLREEGTHEELLRGGGLYAKLHELQFAPAPRGTVA